MNVHDWHLNGLEPAFATVEQWINDQLGYMGAEDEACFAMQVRGENDRGGLAVRILVATDKGLMDMLWERPNDPAARNLTSRHYAWSEVRGLHLRAVTRLDPKTLVHGEPEWGLEIAEPPFALDRAEDGVPLLEFWTSCSQHIKNPAKG